MSARPPRVFTIPPGARFLDELAEAFVSGRLSGRASRLAPDEIAAATIFLPTRRAAQAFLAALAAAAHGPLLLPKVLPLGDLSGDDAPGLPDGAGTAPAIDALERRLELFRLIDLWRGWVAQKREAEGDSEPYQVARSRADAFALAGDLAALIDETIIEDVPLLRLAGAVPEGYDPARHDRYWSLTAKFVEIAAEYWPKALAERGEIDPARQSVEALRRRAATLAAGDPGHPVVIAGSTGSIAATAELMGVVARLSQGAVVLPGLDLAMDEAVWDVIGSEEADLATRYAHPQGAMKRALQRIGIARREVEALGAADPARMKLASQAFLPAEFSDRWAGVRPAPPEGLELVEAADAGQEALAIALMLREALETPGRTAALVTPDRQLARAVQSELERWNVLVSDSAGQPLATSSAGALARLALRASSPEARGADLLALLRHPALLDAFGAPELDAIELVGLRGRRLAGGASGLAALLEALQSAGDRAPQPQRRIDEGALDAGRKAARRLADALAPLGQALEAGCSLVEAAKAHRACLQTLTGPLEGEAPDRAALTDLFDTIADLSDGPDVMAADYDAIFSILAHESALPPAPARNARLKIWGLLEARLLHADRIILGGLNEGVWPPEARSDPFLNRPMRIVLGLQPPERRIGQTAHDFQMLLGHPDIVLTRSRKQGGAPAIASRFWRRLCALIGEKHTKACLARGERTLGFARAIDAPAAVRPVARPEPSVPPQLSPRRLSITEVETLYRDPYAIFARRILKLDPLDPVDPPLDARDRGTAIHDALAAFARAYPAALPPDAGARLIDLSMQAFAKALEEDAAGAEFWRRRFAALAPALVDWEAQRRTSAQRLFIEEPGSLVIKGPEGREILLSGRADRIELLKDGSLAIIDFKSGAPPSEKQARAGYAPQLPLTAALAARRGFTSLSPGPVSELAHVRVGGKPGERLHHPVRPEKGGTIDAFADAELERLKTVLAQLFSGQRGYASHAAPKSVKFAGDYDLLARHLEWLRGGDSAEDEE